MTQGRLFTTGIALLAAFMLAGSNFVGRAPLAKAQDEPTVTVTMLYNTITYQTVPNSFVTAELALANGTKSPGAGGAGPDGLAYIQFFNTGGGGGGGGGGQPVVRSGSTITLLRQAGKALKVTVPALSADVNTDTDTIYGSAPAGASLQVALVNGDTVVTRTVTASAMGRYELVLTGQVDLMPGAVTGTVSYDSAAPDHHRFVATFQAFGADLTVGARGLRGRITPGSRVAMAVVRPDGSRRDFNGPEIVNGNTFTLGAGGFAGQGGGGGGGPMGPPPPITAGDQVVITTTLQGQSPVATTVTVPALTMNMNTSTDMVNGTAPAGMVLTLTADDMDGRTATETTTVAGDGSFSASLSPKADLGPGWRVRAGFDVAPAIRVGVLSVSNKIRVGIDSSITSGRAQPGRQITITLRAADGTVKSEQPVVVNDFGEYFAFFGGFGGAFFPGGGQGGLPARVVPLAGDRIELNFVDADPVFLPVPRLSAVVDVATDTVSGDAPNGNPVRLVVDGMPAAGATGTAGSNDHYELKAAAGTDLTRPAGGSVYTSLPSGNEFFITWAATALNILPGNNFTGGNFIFGNGAAGRQVKLELFGSDGKLVVSQTIDTDSGGIVIIGGGVNFQGGGGQFFTTLTDLTGAPVPVRAGDKLRVTAGDSLAEVVIPPLNAIVFVQTDSVNGSTEPNLPVTIRAADGLGTNTAESTLTADASGNFSTSFAGKFDIRYGDFLQLEVQKDGHLIVGVIIAPGLYLDLDSGALLGSTGPSAKLALVIKRGTQTIAQQTVEAASDGAFQTQLVDASGAPVVLRTGDVITVTPTDPKLDKFSLTVPEIEIAWDINADTVTGRATPGGTLAMISFDAYLRLGSNPFTQAWPELAADGRYATEFVPSLNVRPGTRLFSIYRPPQGHYVAHTRTVPILNAEHTGPNVCGYATPRLDVASTLKDMSGKTLATAAPRSRFDGYFFGPLRDAQKAAVATMMSQTVSAKLETTPVDTLLPQMAITVNRQANQVAGIGPASTRIYINPAVPCSEQQAPQGLGINIQFGFGFSPNTSPTGQFQFFLPPFLNQPGTGLEVAFYGPNDHRVFKQIYRPLVQVFIDAARVDGIASALGSLSLHLERGGTSVAQGTTTVDENGRYTAKLQKDKKDEIIKVGDVVHLLAPEEDVTVTVEALGFDFSADETGLVGRAPAGRQVQVLFRLKDGNILSINLPVDDKGQFRFGGADVPPRADWKMTDISGVRVVLATQSGHQIISQTDKYEVGPNVNPIPIGGGGARKIFLPSMVKRAGRNGQPAVGAGQSALPARSDEAVDQSQDALGAVLTTGRPTTSAADRIFIRPLSRGDAAKLWSALGVARQGGPIDAPGANPMAVGRSALGAVQMPRGVTSPMPGLPAVLPAAPFARAMDAEGIRERGMMEAVPTGASW